MNYINVHPGNSYGCSNVAKFNIKKSIHLKNVFNKYPYAHTKFKFSVYKKKFNLQIHSTYKKTFNL